VVQLRYPESADKSSFAPPPKLVGCKVKSLYEILFGQGRAFAIATVLLLMTITIQCVNAGLENCNKRGSWSKIQRESKLQTPAVNGRMVDPCARWFYHFLRKTM